MTTLCYVDASAALKLLVEEPESDRLARWFTEAAGKGISLCSSFLLYTELLCAAARRRQLDRSAALTLLSGIDLVDLSRDHLRDAARRSMGLRSADAVHLAVALDLRCDLIATYDVEMQDAAKICGLTVVAPAVPRSPSLAPDES